MQIVDSWLQRLKHDLVKRVLWTARDLRDLGQTPSAQDLRALAAGLRQLVDGEGRPVTAHVLFLSFVEEAPLQSAPFKEACAACERALLAADGAVDGALRDSTQAGAALQAVLAVEPAFEALARSMNQRI